MLPPSRSFSCHPLANIGPPSPLSWLYCWLPHCPDLYCLTEYKYDKYHTGILLCLSPCRTMGRDASILNFCFTVSSPRSTQSRLSNTSVSWMGKETDERIKEWTLVLMCKKRYVKASAMPFYPNRNIALLRSMKNISSKKLFLKKPDVCKLIANITPLLASPTCNEVFKCISSDFFICI